MAAVVFVSYAGRLGGAERVLLGWMAAAGGDPVLACPPGSLAAAAGAHGIPVLSISGGDVRLRGGGPGRALSAGSALALHAHELRRIARGVRPALVVANGMRSALAAAGAELGARGRLPWAVIHHDRLPQGAPGAAVRAALRRSALVVAVSATVAEDLGALGATAVAIVHPGVEPARWARIGPPPAGPPEVLVLGALTAWKRPELALEIVAAARAGGADVRLRFVGAPISDGDAPLERRLHARAAREDLRGAVSFAGARDDPAAELERCALLLHCAEREPFGLAVLEAMAAGRPVLVPATGGAAEIAGPAEGVRYPPGDVAVAAAALAELLRDPARAFALGAAGRRRASTAFAAAASRARFAAAVAPLLASLPAERSKRPGPAGAGLTVLTVTHNSRSELARLLASLERHLPGSEVVVVDSGSTDGSAALARGRDGVRAFELGENVGFGRACNRGLAEVRTPAVALLNPDVELLDDSLWTLAAEALREDLPPRLLAPRVLDADGGIQDTVHPRPAGAADVVRALVPPAAVPLGALGRWLAPERSVVPRRVGWAVGCALVAATTTLRDRLGGFDASFFLYGEDLELGLRAARVGIGTWLWPTATVIHHRAHASRPAFGGEPYRQLAAARHAALARGRGPGWARIDDRAQALTFATRILLRRALGRAATRERAQLAAVRGVRR